MASWDDLEQLALGDLGLNLVDFYSHTPRQFTNRIIGATKKETQCYRLSMDRTRMLMFSALQPYLSKGNRNKTAVDLFPFPWDENHQNSKPWSNEEATAFWDRIDNKK